MNSFTNPNGFSRFLLIVSALLLVNGLIPNHYFAGDETETRWVKRIRTGRSCPQFSPKLIHKVEPDYPPSALENKIEGIVFLEFIISPAGLVTSARVISGHPLLRDAARKAVLQWRYAPPRLNGKPVEVVTQTSIGFVLPILPGTTEKPIARVNSTLATISTYPRKTSAAP